MLFRYYYSMNIETSTSATQATHYYTVDEANLMIPDLDLAFIRIKQMQLQVQDLFKLVKKRGIDFVQMMTNNCCCYTAPWMTNPLTCSAA